MTNLKKWNVTKKAGARIGGKAVKVGQVIELTEKQAQHYFNTGQVVLEKGASLKKTLAKEADNAGD